MNIEIKAYKILIQYEDHEPHYVLLGVVVDRFDYWATDIDDRFYFYMSQSEFDTRKTLIGVELDEGTYIRDFDQSEQPEILIGNVIKGEE